jgi:hypothetical protein
MKRLLFVSFSFCFIIFTFTYVCIHCLCYLPPHLPTLSPTQEVSIFMLAPWWDRLNFSKEPNQYHSLSSLCRDSRHTSGFTAHLFLVESCRLFQKLHFSCSLRILLISGWLHGLSDKSANLKFSAFLCDGSTDEQIENYIFIISLLSQS